MPADLRRGDLLAMAATGAYTYAMASAYNRAGRPAVVGVRAGTVTPWLRREDAADLDRLEAVAHRLEPPPIPEGVTIRPATPRDAGAFPRVLGSATTASSSRARASSTGSVRRSGRWGATR